MRLPQVRTVAIIPFLLSGAVLYTGCPQTTSPVERAVHYLERTQLSHDIDAPRRIDFAGNWPQVFHFQQVPAYRIPDVSPFVVAFAHHALALVTQENAAALSLDNHCLDAAQTMRVRAIECLHRFAADTDAPDAGTFGFWPEDRDPLPSDSKLEETLLNLLQGPQLGGTRTPINLSYLPSSLAIPADADVTATTYAAFIDHHQIDGGPKVETPFEQFFADWRDDGTHPLRFSPDWLPQQSGAFLTWLMYAPPNAQTYGNDVDLVVNANVLYALARAEKTDTPGFQEVVALLNDAVAQGIHRTRWDDVSLYYPDSFIFHYCVTRAYAEGPIPALEPAAMQLAAEVANAARQCNQGTYWDRGDPHLNTAFAIVTLIHAGGDKSLIADGITYLCNQQNPVSGAWNEGVFFIARADTGVVIEWESAALTTAIALEAICRSQLTMP